MVKKVESIKHKSKRANIPTEELRDFVADDEKAPKSVLYPRDPSLDPQLVWKGKDEQDQQPLEVPAVPIYIQEKIHPQAIVEDLRAQAKKDKPEVQASLFADFNGIEFEQLIEFYQHEQSWANRMILGDSLMVMTSLAEKENLKGQVQMIYIDPPYGIKFGSNWQVSTRKRDVKDGKAEDFTRQPEQVKAFRDTWKLGIHSYLTYLRDRFTIARDLLTEGGSIFVQISDENVHLVRSLLDEVFGSENFVSEITFLKTSGAGSPAIGTKVIASVADYILWYGKNKEHLKYRQIFQARTLGEEGATQYTWMQSPDGQFVRPMSITERENPNTISSEWFIFAHGDLTAQTGVETTQMAVAFREQIYRPAKGGWKTNSTGMQRLIAANRVMPVGGTLRYKRFFSDFPNYPIHNVWADVRTSGFSDPKFYVVQTNTPVILRCILMTTDPGDIALDPTCGSGTTAYVAEQWGRRWITIDTSRVALALARTRLMAAKYPYYLLADSPEGVKKGAEVAGTLPAEYATGGDIKKGFVYKRVPHITLKSIANNEEIDAIHEKYEGKLTNTLAKLNQATKQSWKDWEVPREAGEKWSEKAKQLHEDWWAVRLERQREIDASIARNADTELLYDQPYEDSKRVRVTGPFTVESLSPHRVLSTDEERPVTEAAAQDGSSGGQFEAMIIENLKKAGVQNTVKNERLKFDRLDTFSGTWIQAAGEYTDADGKSRRIAVSIGPEYGTVGPDQVKEAAKEAVQGVGFDLLIVCGFAFDPHVSEEAKRYGKLTVLPARMNPDLAMGDELLKKTGAGNLFMVFGEPDIQPIDKATGKIVPKKDGKIIVEIKGLDVYDPTTGQIRSSSTGDIACWFIDTNYNSESFFVRHAYFTSSDEPYDKLKRALRAEIDEAAWASLYSTDSRPFDVPETGKIAIKVINHYGDEVLKVYEVKR
jgi:adenine-specific DNA-methyltransferase